MRIVFTCGGTAGHINPALAVAKLIRERRPTADILFIGAEGGMELSLVPREGFRIETVRIAAFTRKLTPAAFMYNARMLHFRSRALRKAKQMLLDFKPDVVVGTGGFASYPAVLAAQRMGIPTAIHESNVKPGITTALLAKRADRVMLGFEEGRQFYRHPDRVIVTGTPVRGDFIFGRSAELKRKLGYVDKPLVVSYWGSLGAREMNKHIASLMSKNAESAAFYHVHATGSFGWKWMPEHMKSLGVNLDSCPHIDMREYIFNMPELMCAADLVICRGGASTLSEVIASATPAIIVPSPNVAENHQEPNARALELLGGAVMILERDLDEKMLYNETVKLLSDAERLKRMSAALAGSSILDASERIYDVIKTLSCR